MAKAKCVLVVEDDADIVANVRCILEDAGYQVAAASNGQSALEYLAASPSLPDVILLDLMMPTMDGFEFRVIQENDPRLAAIPAILMTAAAGVEAKQQRLRVAAVLRKPFGVDDLLQKIATYADGPVKTP